MTNRINSIVLKSGTNPSSPSSQWRELDSVRGRQHPVRNAPSLRPPCSERWPRESALADHKRKQKAQVGDCRRPTPAASAFHLRASSNPFFLPGAQTQCPAGGQNDREAAGGSPGPQPLAPRGQRLQTAPPRLLDAGGKHPLLLWAKEARPLIHAAGRDPP